MAISAPAYLMLERETVLAMVDKGASVMDVAYHFSTYPAVVERLLKQWKQKPKDYTKLATKEQQSNGGVRTGKIHSLRANVRGLVALRDAGWTQKDIAKRYVTDPSTITTVLREYDQKKALAEAGTLVPGKKYGSLIFEGVVHGKARLYLFRHKCGWRETYTEAQWKERTA